MKMCYVALLAQILAARVVLATFKYLSQGPDCIC